MKIIFLTCQLFLLINSSSFAQSSYETGMIKAFELWQNGKPVEAGNLFERIAKAEKENWLPYYYASQIIILSSFEMEDVVKKEQQLKQAQELLEESKYLAGEENVEIMVLQALLHTSYLTMDPQAYGMKLSPVIGEIYSTAYKKEPGNPRVVLARAEWNMGAASFFGEDPKQHCKEIEGSLKLFADYQLKEQFAPSWGEDGAKSLISTVCKN